MKIGIIGGGRIGKVHAENIYSGVSDVEIAAIAEPLADQDLLSWATHHGRIRVCKEYTEVLNTADIDAVLICSPTDTHATICRAAATAGKHIFCEKPLDRDPDVVRETLKIIQDAGVVFQIGFNRRYDHNFRALREAVINGEIGDVHSLRITSRDPEPPPLEYIRVSGGLFMDMAIHDFDMARYLTGSDVVRVYAAGTVLVNPAIAEEGDIDTAVTTLWFANGALGVIENSRQAVYGYDQRAEIFGSKGAASSANDTPSTVHISNAEGVKGEKPLRFFLERYADSYAGEIRAFAQAITEGGEVPGGKDALYSVLIAEAARESMLTKKPVDIPSKALVY